MLHVIQKSTGEEPNFFDKFDSKILVWGVTAFDENRIYSAVGNPTKITFPHHLAKWMIDREAWTDHTYGRQTFDAGRKYTRFVLPCSSAVFHEKLTELEEVCVVRGHDFPTIVRACAGHIGHGFLTGATAPVSKHVRLMVQRIHRMDPSARRGILQTASNLAALV